jgi:hypothetical protein
MRSDYKRGDRERAGLASRNKSVEAREVGKHPEPINPERKQRGISSLRVFCEQYFPERFTKPFCPDHLKVIDRIETAVLEGGLFAMAMPRGSGKTTICECGVLWAVLGGHKHFAMLIGSNEKHATDMLANIRIDLETNDLLNEDFGEVTFYIRALEGQTKRCMGQTSNGELTRIEINKKTIILPTIPGSAASGGIIKTTGLTGGVRGAKVRSARPDLVILDDPQTDGSAKSPSQCATREAIIAGAVLGLAGPGKQISCVMPCTVIRKGDLSDRFLDHELHPQWNGEITKMVYAFPTNQKLWDKYADLRIEGMKAECNGPE